MSGDDSALVRRILGGDRSAWADLVERYLRRAMAAAWQFTESRDDAEDLVQDAFVRVLEALPRYDPARPFGPWFFTILRNAARTRARRDGRRRAEVLSEEVGSDDPWDRVDEKIDGKALLERLPRALDGLSPMQRHCFRLCDLEGLEPREVADMTGLAPPTVRVHLHRARAALRKELEGWTGKEAKP